MKTDKSIIADLPDKDRDQGALRSVAQSQVALYAQAIEELTPGTLEETGHPAQGHCPGNVDAAEADLQSSLPVAER